MDALQKLISFLQKQNPHLFKSLDEQLSEVAGRPVHVVIEDEVTMGGWHERGEDGSLTVLLDKKYPEELRFQIAYHEVIEDHEMVDNGLSYDEAHELASKKEKEKFGARAYERGLFITNKVLRSNALPMMKDVATSTNPGVFTPTAGGGGGEKSSKELQEWLGKSTETEQYICRGIEKRLVRTFDDLVNGFFGLLTPEISRPVLLMKMRDATSHWCQENILAVENSLQQIGRPPGIIWGLADDMFKEFSSIISAAYSEQELHEAFFIEAMRGEIISCQEKTRDMLRNK